MKLLSLVTFFGLGLMAAASSQAQVLWHTDFETPVPWFGGYDDTTTTVTNIDIGPPEDHVLAVQFDSSSYTQYTHWSIQVVLPVQNMPAVSFDPANKFLKCDLLVSLLRPVHLRVEYVNYTDARDLDLDVNLTTTNEFQTFLLPLTAFTNTVWGAGSVGSPTAVDLIIDGETAQPDTTWPCAPDNMVMLDNVSYIVCPPLTIAAPDANSVLLSWPTNATGFLLQQTRDLTAPIWTDVTNAPLVADSMNEVMLPRGPDRAFFRLSGP